jgi:hypothetical protein
VPSDLPIILFLRIIGLYFPFLSFYLHPKLLSAGQMVVVVVVVAVNNMSLMCREEKL